MDTDLFLCVRPGEPPVSGVEVAEGHLFLRTAHGADPPTPRYGAARAWIEEGGWQKKRKRRASLDSTEAALGLTRQPACANAWRGAGAALKARERRGFSMRRAELVRRVSCGRGREADGAQ